MAFAYRTVTLICDECHEEEIDIPVVPAGEGGKIVEVPREYLGWKVSDVRQIGPSCDAKLERN